MKIRVEYTAHLKRAAGTGTETIELPANATLSEAVKAIAAQHGEEFRTHLLDSEGNIHPSVVIAVNAEQRFPESPGTLSDGDTIVLLAAIAGG